MEVNLSYILERAVSNSPEKPAMIFENKVITYKTLNERANQVAQALIAKGVKKDDKVAIMLGNSPELVECIFGIVRSGAAFVILNVRLSPTELEYILNHSDCKVLIYGSKFIGKVNKLRGQKNIEEYICLDSGNNTSDFDDCNYEQLLSQYSTQYKTAKISENDVASLMYTSGTTGKPKGVVQTHSFWVWGVLNSIFGYNIKATDIVLTATPLYHVSAVARVFSTIFLGASNVIMQRFDPRNFLELIEKEKVSMSLLVPTMFVMIKQLPDCKKYDLTSLKRFISGAAPTSEEMLREMKVVFPNAGIINAYGLTEGTLVTVLQPQDYARKLGSVGKPVVNFEIFMADEKGMEVNKGDIGEVLIRGPGVLKEYYKDPNATKQVFVRNWVRTGDLGKIDKEGFLYIVDRKKDLIISGGENIYSLEVENVLYAHEKIQEVAVIAIPDELWGESVGAIVVPKTGETLTEKEVIDFCGTKLAGYKKPKRVIFTDHLPKTDTNKVLKRELKEKYAKP